MCLTMCSVSIHAKCIYTHSLQFLIVRFFSQLESSVSRMTVANVMAVIFMVITQSAVGKKTLKGWLDIGCSGKSDQLVLTLRDMPSITQCHGRITKRTHQAIGQRTTYSRI